MTREFPLVRLQISPLRVVYCLPRSEEKDIFLQKDMVLNVRRWSIDSYPMPPLKATELERYYLQHGVLPYWFKSWLFPQFHDRFLWAKPDE